MGQPQLNRQTKLCPNTVTIITKQGAQTELQTAQHLLTPPQLRMRTLYWVSYVINNPCNILARFLVH